MSYTLTLTAPNKKVQLNVCYELWFTGPPPARDKPLSARLSVCDVCGHPIEQLPFLVGERAKRPDKEDSTFFNEKPPQTASKEYPSISDTGLNLRLRHKMLCFVCLWYVTFYPRENLTQDQFQIILKSRQHSHLNGTAVMWINLRVKKPEQPCTASSIGRQENIAQ